MKIFVRALFRFSFVALMLSSMQLGAQYTLVDDDVVVTDGVIASCSYDFEQTDIVIPGSLDGQTVTGIEGNKRLHRRFSIIRGLLRLCFPRAWR